MGAIFGSAKCRHGRNLGTCYLCENLAAGDQRAQQANNNARAAYDQRAMLAAQQHQENRQNTQSLINNDRQIAQAHFDESRRQIADQLRRDAHLRMREEEIERAEAQFRSAAHERALAAGTPSNPHAVDLAWLDAKNAFKNSRRQDLADVRTRYEESLNDRLESLRQESELLDGETDSLRALRAHTLVPRRWLPQAVVLVFVLLIMLQFTDFSWVLAGLGAGGWWGFRQFRQYESTHPVAPGQVDPAAEPNSATVAAGAPPLTSQTKALFVSLGLPIVLIIVSIGVFVSSGQDFLTHVFWGFVALGAGAVGVIGRDLCFERQAEWDELQSRWSGHADRAGQLAASQLGPHVERSGLAHWVGA